MKKLSLLLTLTLILCANFSYAKSKIDIKKEAEEMTIREILDKYYSKKNFTIGASSKKTYFAKEVDSLGRPPVDSKMFDLWVKEFPHNCPENDCKQLVIYPSLDSDWNDYNLDKIIETARKQKQSIRTHGPISPQCSTWAKDRDRTPEELREMMEIFLTKTSKIYEKNKDVIKWMDVVNETIKNGEYRGTKEAKALQNGTTVPLVTKNPWAKIGFEKVKFKGEEFEMPVYIKRAFQIANKYAPTIKKVYNESTETVNPDQFKILKKTLLYLRSQGLKIDGYGWQGHVSLGWEKNKNNITTLQNAIDWCYENKLEFHITELDVSAKVEKAKMTPEELAKLREAQADTLVAVMEVALKNIDKNLVTVNFWVMTDNNWGNSGKEMSTLFDTQGNPLPAYFRIKELLLEYAKK